MGQDQSSADAEIKSQQVETKPKRSFKFQMIIGFVVVVVIVIVFVCWRVDDWGRDLTSNRAEMKTILVRESPADVAQAIRAWVDRQPRWTVASISAGDRTSDLLLTRSTPIFRFVDDICVVIRLTSAESRDVTTVDAVSQSRVGRGDLGQNPRNLRALASCMDQLSVVDSGSRLDSDSSQ